MDYRICIPGRSPPHVGLHGKQACTASECGSAFPSDSAAGVYFRLSDEPLGQYAQTARGYVRAHAQCPLHLIRRRARAPQLPLLALRNTTPAFAPRASDPARYRSTLLCSCAVTRTPTRELNIQSVYYIRSEPAAADGEKAQRLVLTTTSLRNVVLANATDVLYYEVVTPRWERHLTRVSRLDVNTRCFDPVAELVNGQPPAQAREDGAAGGATGNGGGMGCKKDDGVKWVVALRFHGTGELRAVEDFLHTEKAAGAGRDPDELRAWFRSKDGHKYTWRAHKKRLELTRDDDPDKPLVTFHKEKRYMHVLRMSQHPYLEVHPSALESLDYIVVSFLLMERLRREFGLT